MSLKVYNGIRFKTNNLQKVIEYLHSIRETAYQNARKLNVKDPVRAILTFCEHSKDILCLEKEEKHWDFHASRKLADNLDERYRGYDDPPFVFDVVVIPWKGRLYGCYYCDGIEENERLLDEIAEEYHYQNQTDRPEEIPTREWNRRGEIWDEIFTAYDTPAEAGLVYRVINSNRILNDFELVKELLKSFKKQHANNKQN